MALRVALVQGGGVGYDQVPAVKRMHAAAKRRLGVLGLVLAFGFWPGTAENPKAATRHRTPNSRRSRFIFWAGEPMALRVTLVQGGGVGYDQVPAVKRIL